MRRLVLALSIAAIIVTATAATAWAHVSISPEEAPKGSFSTVTFRVPNEEDKANTVKVAVQFPADPPIADASVQPIPGWTINVKKATLTTPITTDEGDSLTERMDVVTWTANAGSAIKPGEFQQFTVIMALPGSGDSIAFPAIQTYDNGDVVSWTDATVAGGAAPEHPRPELRLTTAQSDSGSNSVTATTSSNDSDNNALAIVALIVGALGLIVGVGAFLKTRRA